jgi:hypothetical protein
MRAFAAEIANQAFEDPVMPQLLESPATRGEFVDRRTGEPAGSVPLRERRQFANSHEELSPAAKELADAVDQYKLAHRRRFITCEEILHIVHILGYRR